MVWKDSKIIKRLDREKVVKSGFSGKFDKSSNFPKLNKKYKDFGKVDFEDHELEEAEERNIKELRWAEKKQRKGI